MNDAPAATAVAPIARRLAAGLLVVVAVAAVLAACGKDDGDCETVSAGPTQLTVRNNLGTGVRAYMPALAFGADMASGECVVVGYEARGTNGLRVEAQQCRNSSADSNCDGRLFGPTRVLNAPITANGAYTLTIDGSTFAGALPAPQ